MATGGQESKLCGNLEYPASTGSKCARCRRGVRRRLRSIFVAGTLSMVSFGIIMSVLYWGFWCKWSD